MARGSIEVEYEILSNSPIARNVYEMVLMGETSRIVRPGQFINITIDGLYLRRPISVCDWDGSTLTIVYKTVGEGTLALSRLSQGAAVRALSGLGNGFDTSIGQFPLVVGGGVGTPPLYALTKSLIMRGARPTVALGFTSAADVFYADKFEALGAKVILSTDDGSAGEAGRITEAISRRSPEYDCVYACGPVPMLRAVYAATSGPAQFSLEERMACGFGACMGCSVMINGGGYKRVCKDGPVFTRSELLW